MHRAQDLHVGENGSSVRWIISMVIMLIALRSFLMARSRSAIRKGNHPLIGAGDRSCTTAIVLGPGGHTGEMLSILSRSPLWALVPTHYLATRIGYDIVRSKVASFESTWPRDNGKPPRKEGVEYHFHLVREARKPATALSTSIIPTLLSVVEGVVLLCRIRPKLLICNGPGACIGVCYASFLLEFLGIIECQMIYIESLTQIDKFSISASICRFVVHRMIVQWPELKKRYPEVEYYGILV